MHTTSNDPVVAFDAQIPEGFLEDTIRAILACYKRADDECRKLYPAPVGHDLRPHLRRAQIETEWAKVVAQYSALSSEYCKNYARNCWHARITCGNIILTESFVDPRIGHVRPAIFRETYARLNQGFLFPDMAPPAPPAEAPLYALLMHDTTPKDQSRPTLMEIIFPDPEGNVVARINLMARYRDLFNQGGAVAEIQIPDEALDLSLQPIAKQKGRNA